VSWTEGLPGVAQVELLRGAAAQGPPRLLIEVPHGADRRAHYDALLARLRGPLPPDLAAFFHVNTDVGAWDLGRALAQRVTALDPAASVALIRCLLPRTFVDTNRRLDVAPGALSQGGMTAGVPSYVRDPADRALLSGLHADYVGLVDAAVAQVCQAGGAVLSPHSYAPRSVDIDGIDDDIAAVLRAAWAPEQRERWPLRPAVDLISTTAQGRNLGPVGVFAALRAALAPLGIEVADNATYHMHPATQGYRYALAWPGRVLCFELRRDLLVQRWEPFQEMAVDAVAIGRLATALAPVVAGLVPVEGGRTA